MIIPGNPVGMTLQALLKHLRGDVPLLHKLLDAFCRGKAYNERGNFHFLASVFFNLTQIPAGRDLLVKREYGKWRMVAWPHRVLPPSSNIVHSCALHENLHPGARWAASYHLVRANLTLCAASRVDHPAPPAVHPVR